MLDDWIIRWIFWILELVDYCWFLGTSKYRGNAAEIFQKFHLLCLNVWKYGQICLENSIANLWVYVVAKSMNKRFYLVDYALYLYLLYSQKIWRNDVIDSTLEILCLHIEGIMYKLLVIDYLEALCCKKTWRCLVISLKFS